MFTQRWLQSSSPHRHMCSQRCGPRRECAPGCLAQMCSRLHKWRRWGGCTHTGVSHPQCSGQASVRHHPADPELLVSSRCAPCRPAACHRSLRSAAPPLFTPIAPTHPPRTPSTVSLPTSLIPHHPGRAAPPRAASAHRCCRESRRGRGASAPPGHTAASRHPRRFHSAAGPRGGGGGTQGRG
jgi:hypothetical protein